MTSSTAVSAAPHIGAGRPYRFSIPRVLLVTVCLALLLTFELYCFHTVFPSFREDLLRDEHKSSAWIAGQVAFMLPFITVILFQYLVYRKHEREDGIFQREKAIEIVFLSAYVYGVLLPVVARISRNLYMTALENGEKIPNFKGGGPKTLLLSLLEWFLRLAIPLAILLLYHATRANREAKEMCAAPSDDANPENKNQRASEVSAT